MSLNTDSEKLVNRIEANKKYQKYDLGNWISTQVNFSEGEKLLDIGCGTGEQLLKYAQNQPNSEIIGIDASKKSLSIVHDQCEYLHITNVRTILSSMDRLSELVEDSYFDVITSCFALYYSKDISKLIPIIKKKLKKDGRLFVCGPIKGNNIELINFQKNLPNSKISIIPYSMTESILPEIHFSFSNVSKNIFQNPIKFLDEKTLFKYWSSYYLYDSNLETIFKEKLHEHFNKYKHFTTTKKTIGIMANFKTF